MKYTAFASCPDELKEVLSNEIKALGAFETEPGYRGVYFECSAEVYYKCHLQLRTASRILRILRRCSAKTPEMLYSQAARIPWEKFFLREQTFLVEGIAGDRGEGALPASLISKKIREAIQTRVAQSGRSAPKVNLTEPDLRVVCLVRHGRADISLDSSGKSMHKRGYRLEGHPAPLKETLAAAILKLADYNGSEPLWDVMCGSGTLAIEAAMISLGKAPLIHRKKGQFGLESHGDFDRSLWRRVQDEARTKRSENVVQPIFASDINPDFVAAARQNALRARVERYIDFDVSDFFTTTAKQPSGLLVANLPYGERLGDPQALKDFYKRFGDHMKQNFAGWRAAILSSEESPYKFIGLRPRRRFTILNGAITCKLLLFDLYAGKKS